MRHQRHHGHGNRPTTRAAAVCLALALAIAWISQAIAATQPAQQPPTFATLDQRVATVGKSGVVRRERAKRSEPPERSGAQGAPASDGVGGLRGAKPSGPEIDEWLQSAEALLREGKRPAATQAFERALDGARQLGLELQQAQALCGLGEIQFAQARYPPAREHAVKAAEIYDRLAAGAASPGVGRANHLLSLVAEREGNLDEAKLRAERAIAAYDAVGDRRGRAVSTLQLLRTTSLGLETERGLYDRVLADARAISDRGIEAGALHSYGDLLFNTGHYAESLAKLEAAAAVFEATGRQGDLGTTYNSLGRLYRAHGRPDAALASQLKALALHEKSNSPFNHLQSLNAVAVTYQTLGDSRQARAYYARALALAEQTSTPRIQDFLRANYAWTLMEEGDYQQAADVLEGVVARGLDRFPNIRMRNIASAHLRLGRKDVALTWAQKTVDTCGESETLNCIHALDLRAEVHAALGNDDAALSDLRNAMTTTEAVRARLVPADFFKQQFHLAQEHLYSRAIALQLRRGRGAEALETSERARSRAFVDLLASRELPIAASVGAASADSLPAGTDPRSGLPLVFRGAPGAAPGGVLGAGTDLLSDTVVAPATTKDLIATAARLRSTLVAYWVTPTQVFIWVASPDGAVRSSQVEVRQATILELIRATTPLADNDRSGAPERRAGLTTRGAASIAVHAPTSRAWRELYDLLITPVRAALPRPGALLTIVPHGPLAALAFAGLQDERGRYLLEDYALHYAPSGTALQFTAGKRRTDSRTGHVLMVADPVPPTLSTLDRPLPRLPGARAESRAIAALMPRARVTRLEGAVARERAVREASHGKAVLHFATHAIVRDDDPFSSFLALGRTPDEDDGLLTAQEIYRLHLDADLVVLSACRSAGGRVTGDGLATFARAFIYAGAPSIVASLWDVADEPTNRLLPEFYRAWLRGASKARALRAAQLRLLTELRAGKVQIQTPAGLVSLPEHPVFWAGFALIGED
jgi:CHAT domain-containing protein/tetratricopeptide (TPR) repeat protein